MFDALCYSSVRSLLELAQALASCLCPAERCCDACPARGCVLGTWTYSTVTTVVLTLWTAVRESELSQIRLLDAQGAWCGRCSHVMRDRGLHRCTKVNAWSWRVTTVAWRRLDR